MSTDSNPSRAGGVLAVAALSVWLVACAAAWDGSTLSGAVGTEEAGAIAFQVSRYSHLTPACTVLARELAEASIRAKVTAYRPTSRVNREKEDRAVAAWDAGRCPDRALAGLAWGVARAVRASEDARRLDAELRP